MTARGWFLGRADVLRRNRGRCAAGLSQSFQLHLVLFLISGAISDLAIEKLRKERFIEQYIRSVLFYFHMDLTDYRICERSGLRR